MRAGSDESVGDGRRGCRRPRANANFGEDMRDMVFDGADAEEKLICDGRVSQSSCQQDQNLALSRSERLADPNHGRGDWIECFGNCLARLE